jgi:hypothetical protein
MFVVVEILIWVLDECDIGNWHMGLLLSSNDSVLLLKSVLLRMFLNVTSLENISEVLIYWKISVETSGCVFENCTVGGLGGGGFALLSHGDVNLSYCSFEGCSMITQDGNGGGALLVPYSLSTYIFALSFVSCSASVAVVAESRVSANGVEMVRGGALYTPGSIKTTLHFSNFTNCAADADGLVGYIFVSCHARLGAGVAFGSVVPENVKNLRFVSSSENSFQHIYVEKPGVLNIYVGIVKDVCSDTSRVNKDNFEWTIMATGEGHVIVEDAQMFDVQMFDVCDNLEEEEVIVYVNSVLSSSKDILECGGVDIYDFEYGVMELNTAETVINCSSSSDRGEGEHWFEAAIKYVLDCLFEGEECVGSVIYVKIKPIAGIFLSSVSQYLRE